MLQEIGGSWRITTPVCERIPKFAGGEKDRGIVVISYAPVSDTKSKPAGAGRGLIGTRALWRSFLRLFARQSPWSHRGNVGQAKNQTNTISGLRSHPVEARSVLEKGPICKMH